MRRPAASNGCNPSAAAATAPVAVEMTSAVEALREVRVGDGDDERHRRDKDGDRDDRAISHCGRG
jgi:hypothetical protein